MPNTPRAQATVVGHCASTMLESSLTFASASEMLSVTDHGIACRTQAGTCLSRELVAEWQPFKIDFTLKEMVQKPVLIGFVPWVVEAVASRPAQQRIGRGCLTSSVAVLLQPGFVKVVVNGTVSASYPCTVANGLVVQVLGDGAGNVSFTVHDTHLHFQVPVPWSWGAVHVGVSLTAAGQEVTVPLSSRPVIPDRAQHTAWSSTSKRAYPASKCFIGAEAPCDHLPVQALLRALDESRSIADAIPPLFHDDPAVPTAVRVIGDWAQRQRAQTQGEHVNLEAFALGLPPNIAALMRRCTDTMRLSNLFAGFTPPTSKLMPANPREPMLFEPIQDAPDVLRTCGVFSPGVVAGRTCNRCMAGTSDLSQLMEPVFTFPERASSFCCDCFEYEKADAKRARRRGYNAMDATVHLGGSRWDATVGTAVSNGEVFVALFHADSQHQLLSHALPAPDPHTASGCGVYLSRFRVEPGQRIALRHDLGRFMRIVDGVIAETIAVPTSGGHAMRFAAGPAAMLQPCDSDALTPAAPPPPGAPVQLHDSAHFIQAETTRLMSCSDTATPNDVLPKWVTAIAGAVGTVIRHLPNGMSAINVPGLTQSACVPTAALAPIPGHLRAPVPRVRPVEAGSRVVRNPQCWRYGAQDGRNGDSADPASLLGTVHSVCNGEKGIIKVEWDSSPGQAIKYRYGRNGCHDVLIAPVPGERVVRNPPYWSRCGSIDGDGSRSGTVTLFDMQRCTVTVNWGEEGQTRIVTHEFSRFFQEVLVAERPHFELPKPRAASRWADNTFSDDESEEAVHEGAERVPQWNAMHASLRHHDTTNLPALADLGSLVASSANTPSATQTSVSAFSVVTGSTPAAAEPRHVHNARSFDSNSNTARFGNSISGFLR